MLALYTQYFPSLWKKSQAYYSGGIRTHNLCNSRAVSYQLDHRDCPVARGSSNLIFSHRNRERAEYKMLTLELELETLEYNQNQSSLSLIQIWHKYIPGDGMEWWPQCQTLWFFFLLSCPEGSQHTPRQSQSPSCWRKKDCDPLGHLCLPHHGKWWGISEERKKET